MGKTRKRKKQNKKKTYTKKNFSNRDSMVTTVWGPQH